MMLVVDVRSTERIEDGPATSLRAKTIYALLPATVPPINLEFNA